jgi:hypothetical protein
LDTIIEEVEAHVAVKFPNLKNVLSDPVLIKVVSLVLAWIRISPVKPADTSVAVDSAGPVGPVGPSTPDGP